MSESPRQEADSSTDSTDKDVSVCPTCGDGFGNEHGMKIHHKKVHGESIAGVEGDCSWCGETFRQNAHIFEVTENSFCSDECESNWRSKAYLGENNPRWSGGEFEVECQRCGETYKEISSRLDRTSYCSEKCRDTANGEIRRGENHPMWKEETTDYYGANWNQQRRKARERDNHTCQDCGIHENQLNHKIPVHHITPRRDYAKDGGLDYKQANRLENLVSLCPSCHRKWEGIPLRPDTRE